MQEGSHFPWLTEKTAKPSQFLVFLLVAYLTQIPEERSGEWREGSDDDTVLVHRRHEIVSALHVISDLAFEFPNRGGHRCTLHILEAEHDSATEDEVLPTRASDVTHLLSSLVHPIESFLKLPAHQRRDCRCLC
jgi:hypothetical protein